MEEYLGGPDAAVERVLSAFQDALACVYLHKFALSRITREELLPFSDLFYSSPHLSLSIHVPTVPSAMISVGSTVIWIAT